MKRAFSILCAVAFAAAGCQDLSRMGGEIAAEQAYQDTYKREFQKAKAAGATDEDARASASKAAGARAGKSRELFGGIGDVAAAGGEIDYDSEFAIGQSLALEAFRRFGLPVQDPELQKYVNLVGTSVAANSSRPDIPYHFVVIASPLYNAFACPGGIIFVSSTMVKALEDEAELAAILAHEVAHVSHRHALKSIRRAKFFEGVGRITAATMKGEKGKEFQSMIGDLQTVLFDKGLDKNMEYEADLAAMQTAYRTGYDPKGFLRVLEELEKREAAAQKQNSWFSTHPPPKARLDRTRAKLAETPADPALAKAAERFALYRKRL
jgi:beta-barrel assembly-enhancing protease